MNLPKARVTWQEVGVEYAFDPPEWDWVKVEYFCLHIPTTHTTHGYIYTHSLYQAYQLINYWNQQANWKYYTPQIQP